jgi:hypothetical protein
MAEGSKALYSIDGNSKKNEGSKTHSNGGRIGNALPLMAEGSKALSKWR